MKNPGYYKAEKETDDYTKLSPFPHCCKLRKWRETARSSLCLLLIEKMLVLNTIKTMLGTDYF